MTRGEKDIFKWGIEEEDVLGYGVSPEHHPVNGGERI
jgi:hypothetical protein